MFKTLAIALKKHAMYRQTIKELSKLEDRELRDIGIERSMIESLAREAADIEENKSKPNFFIDFFKIRTEKDRIEEYLSESANTSDLENRLRNVDRGLAPWQIRVTLGSQGWI